jgi:hypothetical protein
VVEVCITPGVYSVAVVAVIIAGNMIGIFPGCKDVVVTLPAAGRCSFESSINMAAGTINEFMFSGKRESCREMVEAAGILCGDHGLAYDEK